MEALAREVFEEQNKVRQNPASYIPYLEEMLTLFKGMVLYKPGEIPLLTNEGPGLVQECIQYLKALKPAKPLQWEENMARAASDHANDIGPKGLSDHTGSDGSSMSMRLTKHGEWGGKIGENIDFGCKKGRDVVLSLIIDDGVPNRGHRNNLFSPDFLKTGIACAKHTQWGYCTVLDYASEYSQKGGKPNPYSINSTTTPKFNNQMPENKQNASSVQQPQVNYEALARDVFTEQNKIRIKPSSFIPYLEDLIKQFQGMILKKAGEISLRTHEGPGAVQECINFLRAQKPLNPLIFDDNMAKACRDHANDIGPRNLSGHTGSDGSSMSERLERYGNWNGKIGENCDFGSSLGRDIVISLIVDDGVANRGHRKNLFSEEFKKVGIACCNHIDYKTCTVIDYASAYEPKGINSGQSAKNNDSSNKSQGYTPFPVSNFNTGSDQFNLKGKNLIEPTYTQTASKTTTYSSQDPNDQNIKEQMKKLNIVSNNLVSPVKDSEIPPNTIEILTSKKIQIVNGKKTITETKTYKIADGTQKVSERTYFE